MQGNEPGDEAQYTVVSDNGKFDLLSPSGRRIMRCSDAGSASQYALLLNEAYMSGYRAANKRLRKSAAK